MHDYSAKIITKAFSNCFETYILPFPRNTTRDRYQFICLNPKKMLQMQAGLNENRDNLSLLVAEDVSSTLLNSQTGCDHINFHRPLKLRGGACAELLALKSPLHSSWYTKPLNIIKSQQWKSQPLKEGFPTEMTTSLNTTKTPQLSAQDQCSILTCLRISREVCTSLQSAQCSISMDCNERTLPECSSYLTERSTEKLSRSLELYKIEP